jgi:hypothetical protein
VVASSHEISTGSPFLPFTKFELFETIGVVAVLNVSCVRYSLIHAPECLPSRAYGSKYHRPTACLPCHLPDLDVRVIDGNAGDRLPLEPEQLLRRPEHPVAELVGLRYGFTSFWSRSYFALRTFSA